MSRRISTLPRLSSSELEHEFGDDELALQRYRMLAALLHEGRTAGEVAQTFGVSRETLRRLRRAVAERGLDGLRRRRPGGGHRVRRSPLLRAVEAVLQAQPNATPAQVVRLVGERLEPQQIKAPRSTIYRLLNVLQDEVADEDDSNAGSGAAHELLRAAMPLLLADPPLELGRSRLALQLIPYESDTLRRGQRLQAALQRAIALLRPADETGPRLDSAWRPYLIIAGEYQAGEERSDLQSALALSASTYSRAKRAGMLRILDALPHILAAAPPPAPPVGLITPPAPPAVFDRDRELTLYQRLLQRRGLALIWGPVGRGKSALAAALAARLQAREQRVVWHSVRSADDNEVGLRLLTALAAGLALHNSPDLWRLLVAAPGQPNDPDAALLLLARGLESRRWLVAIDGVDDLADGLSGRLLDVLADACRRGHIRLLLTSRQTPNWLEAQGWPSLPPLDDDSERSRFCARLEALWQEPQREPLSFNEQQLDLVQLRERAAQLVASMRRNDPLSPEQLAAVRSALAAIEHALSGLRRDLP